MAHDFSRNLIFSKLSENKVITSSEIISIPKKKYYICLMSFSKYEAKWLLDTAL